MISIPRPFGSKGCWRNQPGRVAQQDGLSYVFSMGLQEDRRLIGVARGTFRPMGDHPVPVPALAPGTFDDAEVLALQVLMEKSKNAYVASRLYGGECPQNGYAELVSPWCVSFS
jgi:hypothetical protein